MPRRTASALRAFAALVAIVLVLGGCAAGTIVEVRLDLAAEVQPPDPLVVPTATPLYLPDADGATLDELGVPADAATALTGLAVDVAGTATYAYEAGLGVGPATLHVTLDVFAGAAPGPGDPAPLTVSVDIPEGAATPFALTLTLTEAELDARAAVLADGGRLRADVSIDGSPGTLDLVLDDAAITVAFRPGTLTF